MGRFRLPVKVLGFGTGEMWALKLRSLLGAVPDI